jgi:hypothetical protein
MDSNSYGVGSGEVEIGRGKVKRIASGIVTLILGSIMLFVHMNDLLFVLMSVLFSASLLYTLAPND